MKILPLALVTSSKIKYKYLPTFRHCKEGLVPSKSSRMRGKTGDSWVINCSICNSLITEDPFRNPNWSSRQICGLLKKTHIMIAQCDVEKWRKKSHNSKYAAATVCYKTVAICMGKFQYAIEFISLVKLSSNIHYTCSIINWPCQWILLENTNPCASYLLTEINAWMLLFW